MIIFHTNISEFMPKSPTSFILTIRRCDYFLADWIHLFYEQYSHEWISSVHPKIEVWLVWAWLFLPYFTIFVDEGNNLFTAVFKRLENILVRVQWTWLKHLLAYTATNNEYFFRLSWINGSLFDRIILEIFRMFSSFSFPKI